MLRTLISLYFISCLLTGLEAQAATSSGQVVYAHGQVTALGTNGKVRPLSKGSKIYNQETLATGDGRVQVRFTDGGFISLQVNSRFKLEDYAFHDKDDDKGSAIFSLLKGGLRAISGLIGHRQPEAYQLRTSVATIGIRGTAFNALLCQADCFAPDGEPIDDGLHTHTEDGTIYVFNEAGSLELPSGQNSLTRGRLQMPRLSTAAAFARKQLNNNLQRLNKRQRRALRSQMQTLKQQFISGNQFTHGGQQTILAAPSSTVLSNAHGVTVSNIISTSNDLDIFLTQGKLVGGINQVTSSLQTINLQAMLINSDPLASAKAAFFTSLVDPFKLALFLQKPAIATDTGASNFAFWSRWTNGRVLQIDLPGSTSLTNLTGNQSIHMLFGRPVANMPTGTATYLFDDGTRSTSFSGASIGAGVTSGQINVDFTAASATLNMNVSHNMFNYNVTGSMGIAPKGFFTTPGATAIGGVGPCASTGCTTDFNGGLMGLNAEGAGLGYKINEVDPITGVATFKR